MREPLFESNLLRASLARCFEQPPELFNITRVADLSPGLARSRVFRLYIEDAQGLGRWPSTVILKIPDTGIEGGVKPGDALTTQRERRLIESRLLDALPRGLKAPSVYGIDVSGEQTWIWMQDMARPLAVVWRPSLARLAAGRCALLHKFYRENESRLSQLDGLSRDGWALYAHYIPACHENLDALLRRGSEASLFDRDEIAGLHQCLEAFDWADGQMRRLKHTFMHGDFHIRNLGLDDDEALVMLDWAHAGFAPHGCDIATFSSVYKLFGGFTDEDFSTFERSMVAEYCRALKEAGETEVTASEVQRACTLWHLTWGLHLRLGPGLSALLSGAMRNEAEQSRSRTDIRIGCAHVLREFERTLSWESQ